VFCVGRGKGHSSELAEVERRLKELADAGMVACVAGGGDGGGSVVGEPWLELRWKVD
jgi:hypothetical protein